jgi:nitric oxide reductase NorD protein
MKALTEAKQQGVQSFCLTVDPSGHDYLRLMCPDRQYMVIQDVSQLPNELSKVYRSLTG